MHVYLRNDCLNFQVYPLPICKLYNIDNKVYDLQ
jgi:hypothetical protein